MKTFVHLRLKQYIEKHNIIVEKIAKEMKVNKGSLYNYFNGKTEIRLSILEKFVKINPTINIEMLLTAPRIHFGHAQFISGDFTPDLIK